MRPAPAAGPSQKYTKKSSKKLSQKSCMFYAKIKPQPTSKSHRNLKKSAQVLSNIFPEWIRRPTLEKVAFRPLPDMPQCVENTTPAKLFVLPRGRLQTRFGLNCISAYCRLPFRDLGRSKVASVYKKRLARKTLKTCVAKLVPKRRKLPPTRVGENGPGHLCLLPRTHLRSRWGPDPILASVCFKNCYISDHL